jgi:hypothetical protein
MSVFTGFPVILDAALDYIEAATPGTVTASTAVVADASLNVAALNNLSMTGDLTVDGAVGTGTATPGLVKLTTPELTVVALDQLGRIEFSAPLESSGTDAILVGASIWAEAGDTFSATVNDTDIVFATGLSEAAAEKMRLTSAGVLEVVGATGYVAASRPVVADAAFASPVALTANQSGALCVFDETAGAIFTLPAAVAGLWYEFVIAVASSSNHHRVACTTGDFLLGSVVIHATDDTGLSSAHAANGTTHLAIQLDAATVGRLAGGKFKCTAISGTQWIIEGNLLGTGTIATPFETS